MSINLSAVENVNGWIYGDPVFTTAIDNLFKQKKKTERNIVGIFVVKVILSWITTRKNLQFFLLARPRYWILIRFSMHCRLCPFYRYCLTRCRYWAGTAFGLVGTPYWLWLLFLFLHGQRENVPTSTVKLGSLATTTAKMNSRYLKLYHAYSISFNSSNVGIILFWSWILKDCIKVQEKKRKVVVLCWSRPRLRNVHKSVMDVQSFCFADKTCCFFAVLVAGAVVVA